MGPGVLAASANYSLSFFAAVLVPGRDLVVSGASPAARYAPAAGAAATLPPYAAFFFPVVTDAFHDLFAADDFAAALAIQRPTESQDTPSPKRVCCCCRGYALR